MVAFEGHLVEFGGEMIIPRVDDGAVGPLESPAFTGDDQGEDGNGHWMETVMGGVWFL